MVDKPTNLTAIPSLRNAQDEKKTDRIEIRCRPASGRRWRVHTADRGTDSESALNELIDFWKLTHPGTMRAMPGRTFGQDAPGFRMRP